MIKSENHIPGPILSEDLYKLVDQIDEPLDVGDRQSWKLMLASNNREPRDDESSQGE